MKTHLSGPIIRLSKAMPALARPALSLAARVLSSSAPHWVLRQVASDVNYRVPVDARLGNGMQVRVIWTDVVGWEICTHGYYEPSTVRVIEHFAKAGMVFIDAGANIGQYTLLAAGLGASVHSFEPDPETFPLLEYNVSTNNFTNVCLNRCALSERCETAAFYLGRPDKVAWSSLRRSAGASASCFVECQSLDHYMEQHTIRHVDLIKIDVEGAELCVLRGASLALLQKPKPYVIVEFAEQNQHAFGFSCAELREFLRSHSYNLFRITDAGLIGYEPRENEEVCFNVLAIPR